MNLHARFWSWCWLGTMSLALAFVAAGVVFAQEGDEPASAAPVEEPDAEASEFGDDDLDATESESAEPETPEVESPESELPDADPDPAATVQELMQSAYAQTRTAQSLAEYEAVIKLCDRGLAIATDKTAKDYFNKLLAWGYNRRGKAFSEQASALSDADEIAALEAQALADFEASVQLDPKKWQAIHNRGVSYAFAGKLREALADFNTTIKLNPKYANVWFNRAEIYYQLGDYNAAVRDYTQAATLSPDDAVAVAARGHAYYQLKQYRNSLQDYNRAVTMSPDNVVILTDRGEVYANLGYWEQAATDFRRAVELDDTYGRAYMGAAWTMATCPDERFRDAEAAVTNAEKAIELDGEKDWRYLDALAAAYASASEFDKAQEAIDKAIEAAPGPQKKNLESRQKLYVAKKPYRETARTATATTSRNR